MAKHLKYKFSCLTCKQEISSSDPNQKLCSDECRKRFYNHSSIFRHLPSHTVGAIAEFEVGLHLIKNGFAVFKALSQSCFCDLVAIKGDEKMYIEARTGYKALNKKIYFPKALHGEKGLVTTYGIFIPETDEVFLFPVTKEDIEKYTKKTSSSPS